MTVVSAYPVGSRRNHTVHERNTQVMPITQKQADFLVRKCGYSYDEVRNFTSGYAGKIIRQYIDSKKKAGKA